MDALALTCIRDEGAWLLDWIAHHRAAGFSHFLIASHDCADGTDRMLDALAETGLVTHLPFTPEGPRAVQWQALRRLAGHPRYRDADLALFFDLDEYLVLDGVDLAGLLPDAADAVPLRWRFFGHAGLRAWEDRPVPERFTRAAPPRIAHPLAQLFKTLHRPRAFAGLGVHRPKGTGARWLSAAGHPLPEGFATTQGLIHLLGVPPEGERAGLNHYAVRSIEEFVLKAARGLPNHSAKPVDAGYWALRNFNVTTDHRIAPMRPAAQAARAALAAFGPLHEAAVAHHRARLAALSRQRSVVDLMWQLELLTGSTPPAPEALRGHLARLGALSEGAGDG